MLRPSRDLSSSYGAGASAYDVEAMQQWKQQWDAAAAAAKAKDWPQALMLLEKSVMMRPDFAKGYVPLSRAYGQAGDPGSRVAALHRGLAACAAHGKTRPLLEELRKVEAAEHLATNDALSTVIVARDEAAARALLPSADCEGPEPSSSSLAAVEPPWVERRQSSLPDVAADSLSAAGFERQGWAWSHPPTGTMVIEAAEPGAPPEVYNEALRQADIDAFVALTFARGQWDAASGQRLVRWVEDAIVLDGAAGPEDGEAMAGEPIEEEVDVGLSRLPSAAQLGAEEERQLRIYTWGDKVVSQYALQSECGCSRHFNAKPLNGRGGGADLKRNATQDPRIVRNVVTSMQGGEGLEWLRHTVRAVEADDLHAVSVYCSQGRHRSVSAALILRARYYPRADVVHLKLR